MVETVIKFENVRKKFGNLIAVNNFNLEIKKGEVVGFIGPNGAGKTTTLKLLARLINPNSGKIFVINNQGTLQNVFKDSKNLVELGFLIDIPHFYNSTPYRLLKYIANIRNYPKEKIKQRIDHLLQIFKLFTWKYKRINTFSKGMNQKIGFIAAVIHEPEIIVLDEPQTGLDPNARIKIRNYIRSLKDEGKTVFVSSHMLHEIAEVCDKIVLINQGSILGFDTIENLEHLLATKEIVCKLLYPFPTEKTNSIIRLVNSYSEGLYKAYDVVELDFTNNAKEQLFHRSKHHFKALLGRENVARAFLNHGGLHVQLLDIDFTKKNVTSVLLACETPLIEAQRKEFNAQYATVRRTWRIREKDTGNFTQFKDNLTQLERS